MRHRGGRTVIQTRWWNVGSRSRNAKGNAESDELIVCKFNTFFEKIENYAIAMSFVCCFLLIEA